jgi:hypothetical protein
MLNNLNKLGYIINHNIFHSTISLKIGFPGEGTLWGETSI